MTIAIVIVISIILILILINITKKKLPGDKLVKGHAPVGIRVAGPHNVGRQLLPSSLFV